MEEFKEGDLVELKSGGPKMTVSEIETLQRGGRKLVWCNYFSGNDLQLIKVYSETLKKI